MTTGKRQRGISLIGGLLMLIVVCFVALMAIRIVPIYVSYFTVKSALEGLPHDPASRQMSLPRFIAPCRNGSISVMSALSMPSRSRSVNKAESKSYHWPTRTGAR